MDFLNRTHVVVLVVLALPGCVPDVESDLSRVDTPRILAVRAEPAEVAPGQPVTFTALYADADGTIADAPLTWAFCNERKPLAELGPVSRYCYDIEDLAVAPFGEGITATGNVPTNACRLFGSDPPPASAPGQPNGRPVDPDITGGYYQPVPVFDPNADPSATLFEVRIACGLVGATPAQGREFRQRYVRNQNPAIRAITVSHGEQTLPVGDDPVRIPAGASVTLRLEWPECVPDGDAAEVACEGAEVYTRFDLRKLDLVTERESLRVAWYATAGTFESASTGRASEDPETFVENRFTAPETRGEVVLWTVLRDDRGGSAWASFRVRVE